MTVAEGELVLAVAERSTEITDALSRLEAHALHAPSALPGGVASSSRATSATAPKRCIA